MTGVEWPDLLPALREQLPQHHGVLDGEIELVNVSESATFRVRSADGGEVRIVRVYRAGRHSASKIASELSWIEALAEEGVPTPRVFRTDHGEMSFELVGPDGALRRCAVFAFVPEDASRPGLVQTFVEIGSICAVLQRHARSWRPAHAIDRVAWDLEATMSEDTDWGSWPELTLQPEDRTLLERARAKVVASLPRFEAAATQLLHADLKPVNSIWSAGTLHVIDFDDCGYGVPMFDLAASLTGYEDHPLMPELVEAWLLGFTRHQPVTSSEMASLPSLIMQRRLMILGWLAAHPDSRRDIDLADAVAGTVGVARRYLTHQLLPARCPSVEPPHHVPPSRLKEESHHG